jgi:hypothetical protein
MADRTVAGDEQRLAVREVRRSGVGDIALRVKNPPRARLREPEESEDADHDDQHGGKHDPVHAPTAIRRPTSARGFVADDSRVLLNESIPNAGSRDMRRLCVTAPHGASAHP